MESLPPERYVVHIEMAAFLPIAIVAGIGILMSSLFIAVNIKYRDYKVLKMTSPNLNLVMLCGSILFCAAVVLFGSSAWLPDSPTQQMVNIVWQINHAGIWLSSVGFTLLFAPLATKTWRVHRIFSDAAVKGRVIKDDRLLCFVALMVIFDLGYLALWFGIDSPKCQVIPRLQLPGFLPPVDVKVDVVGDEAKLTSLASTESLEYGFTCASKFTPLWIIILFLYKAPLLYYIIYVAWATRYVTLPSMKDSGGLIISIFVTLTSFSIATPLVSSLQRWPNAQYIVMSSAVFFPLFTVLILHFVPKVLLIRRHHKNEVLGTSFPQYSTQKPPEFSEDEIRDLAIQNASLRKEVAEKQKRYKTVLEQLRVTKAKLFEVTMLTESTEIHTCGSDDALRSTLTESTGDFSTTDGKGTKRKESLARELANKVTRALILKSQGVLKSDDVSISVPSSSASQQGDDEIKATESEEMTSSSKGNKEKADSHPKVTSDIPQKDPDVTMREKGPENESPKRPRHVSFNNLPLRRVPNDLSEPASHLGYTKLPVIPKPVLPVMGRNSWDYYTRGTGFLRYKATVLNQGANGTIAAITGYPLPHPRKNNSMGGKTGINKSGPFQSTPKINEMLHNGIEMKHLCENGTRSKNGDFKYFSTSASSRSPSSSTDMTSSLGRSNDGTIVSNNNVNKEVKKPSSIKSSEGTSSNNNTDVPSVNSAFSVVKKSSSGDEVTSAKRRFIRMDDIGITYEDYSSGSDSDEYENTATSMDSITCELFPPLTPRHKHYLRRYDAMQAKYLANRQKYQRHKKSQIAEKSEGYSSDNDVNSEKKNTRNDVTSETPASGKSGHSSISQSYLNRESKRKLLNRAPRKINDAYLYDSITSSDSDSDSDWRNSAALQQCWERVAQMGQLPLLKAGPITYSHTNKDGIFV